MIWRVILFWLLAANLAFANLPRFSSVVSVTFCSSQLWGFHYDAVNSARALTYGDFTFASTNNTLANGFNPFTTIAQNAYGVKVTNNLTLYMLSSINLLYDASGNLTNDGTRSFFYDAENQLTNVSAPGVWQVVFVYDGLNRRRIERDYNWQGSGFVLTNEIHFVDDGMNIVQERDTNNTALVTYTRGLDLSASLSGAGGIGGLLARTGTNASTFYHTDDSGNITAMQDTNQNIVTRYEYDDFGRFIGRWGSMASLNKMRASSMPYNDIAGVVGYWGRFYDPNFQRWINRDPIGERGGINLYQFNDNNPVRFIDPFGLQYDPNALNALTGPPGPATGVAPGQAIGFMVGSIAGVVVAATGAGLAAESYGASLLAALGLGAAAAETPQGQEALQTIEGPLGQDLEAAVANASKLAKPSLQCIKTPTIPVSRWGRPGLNPGDWVMKGNTTPWNYFWSGKYQPAWFPGKNIPAPFSSGATFSVLPSSLSWPSGFDKWKGILGQRIYDPD